MAGEYMLSSVHVHSKLCDGKNTLEELAVTAWRMGLKTLGFTGHSHTPCDLEYCMSPSRTARYKGDIAKLKKQYEGKLDILYGLEWDLYSDDDPSKYDYWIRLRPLHPRPQDRQILRDSTGGRATWPTASTPSLTATVWLRWRPTLTM